jgi:dihydropteroate synthase
MLSYAGPAGIVHGASARAAIASGHARPLAGGPLAFTSCEVITRTENGPAAEILPLVERPSWAEWYLQIAADRREGFAGLVFQKPLIMGILNVTPDSFSDGGRYLGFEKAVDHAKEMIAAGADIIDIGGESSRPGAEPVSVEIEIERVLPVIKALVAEGAVVSIDTRRAKTMEIAIGAGARIVNDVTALAGDPDSLKVVAESGANVILMHMQGEPKTMQAAPDYSVAALDVFDFLVARIDACLVAGIDPGSIAIDPGIGFGKTPAHNVEILSRLALFHGLGCPLLIGVSRKSLIAALSHGEPPEDRLPGSLAAELCALSQGAQILRVHDVAATAQAVAVWQGINGTKA